MLSRACSVQAGQKCSVVGKAARSSLLVETARLLSPCLLALRCVSVICHGVSITLIGVSHAAC